MVYSSFSRKRKKNISVIIQAIYRSNFVLFGIPITTALFNENSVGVTSILIAIIVPIISNVPCAILLSKFTSSWQQILIGVNIGGMGTIIASLASLISYKFYAKEYDGKKYLFKFIKYNFSSLIIFTVVFYVFLYLQK